MKWLKKVFNELMSSWYEDTKDDRELDFVSVLRMKPGDVLVLKIEGRVLNAQKIEELERRVKHLIGERNPVLIVSGEWKMEVLRYDMQEIQEE